MVLVVFLIGEAIVEEAFANSVVDGTRGKARYEAGWNFRVEASRKRSRRLWKVLKEASSPPTPGVGVQAGELVGSMKRARDGIMLTSADL
jgi:hypothetical protein